MDEFDMKTSDFRAIYRFFFFPSQTSRFLVKKNLLKMNSGRWI